MRLGIDFGTTRIVVAAADRGNYPVVSFDAPDGSCRDWFPPLVAILGEQRVYGWEAYLAQENPGWTVLRSVKRLIEDTGPETRVQIGEQEISIAQVLTELFSALRRALLEHSTLEMPGAEPLEVLLGVPANANSNQRFLTVEAFRKAGFDVLGLLNEPSAASIEFGHRQSEASNARDRILVYDLGGGTFDVSLVEMDEESHAVIESEGIATLGGDDFDEVLAELALDAAALTEAERDSLSQAELFRLHEECREKKEALSPNSRRIVLDLERVRDGWGQVVVSAADFYERCRPLIDETLHAIGDIVAAHPEPLEALYVTGGGSELPLVSRALRESFGRRVRRSAYTRSATAIGLAIQADAQTTYVLRERFNRYFGVWRESEDGQVITFDSLFDKGTSLPGPGDPPLVRSRQYHPVHNIGHFRYLECSQRAEDGRPTGGITVWDEIRFPFDPELKDAANLPEIPVGRCGPAHGQVIEERYSCDSSGTVEVRISNVTSGYERRYTLGRWAPKAEPVKPGRRKARTGGRGKSAR